MWDEKKFFDDFVKESEKVKPDNEFVEQLKNMVNEENVGAIKKRNQTFFMRGSMVAVAAILCLSVGTIVWKGFDDNKNSEKDIKQESSVSVHAGGNSEIQSGIIGSNVLELEEVIVMIEEDKVEIKDEAGEIISYDNREKLLGQLNKAKKVENAENIEMNDNDYAVYTCEGEEIFEIKIYSGKYILIGDSDTVYQIK